MKKILKNVNLTVALPFHPCSSSDETIGTSLYVYREYEDLIDGKWLLLFYWGRFCLMISLKAGTRFCTCYATGTGG